MESSSKDLVSSLDTLKRKYVVNWIQSVFRHWLPVYLVLSRSVQPERVSTTAACMTLARTRYVIWTNTLCVSVWACTCLCVWMWVCLCVRVRMCVCVYVRHLSARTYVCMCGRMCDQHPIDIMFSCVSYKNIYLKPSDYTFLNTPIGTTSITCNDKTQWHKWTTVLRGSYRHEGGNITIV